MTENAQPAPTLQTWKLTLAYDGTEFRGWQVQPGERTVQGELQAALGRITGESPLPQGSGRTDAGVHALGQVASFALAAPIPAENLQRALNRTLPPSIRILETKRVRSTFHARHSAVAKTYEYRVFRDALCPPFLARTVYACPWPMDVAALQRSARAFLGEHDFLSFAATDPDLASRNISSAQELDQEINAPPAPEKLDSGGGGGFNPRITPTESTRALQAAEKHFALEGHDLSRAVSAAKSTRALAPEGRFRSAEKEAVRTIFSSAWEQQKTEAGELLVYRVRGSGFLHHMVRNLVGTMLDVGRGQLSADAIPGILAARNRAAAGPTAPARGLFLHSVEYDEQESARETE
jgi:tRNA pseudouridine38-40 synthase